MPFNIVNRVISWQLIFHRTPKAASMAVQAAAAAATAAFQPISLTAAELEQFGAMRSKESEYFK